MKHHLLASLLFTQLFGSSLALAADASPPPAARPFAKIALGTPRGITVDGVGNLYVADVDAGKMHKITPKGEVSAFGGASIPSPIGLAAAKDGAICVADAEDDAVYRIASDGTITAFAKTKGETSFSSPTNVAVDAEGNVFVANNVASNILKITPAGAASVFAGKTGETGSADGTGAAARFAAPLGIAIDGRGNLYVADKDNSNIRKITPAGVVSTVAGEAGKAGNTDGTGTAARFDAPRALAADASGTLFVADTDNHCIRKITAEGVVTTFAGQAGATGKVEGVGKAARFNDPRGIAVDAQGYVYVADGGNSAIRRIAPDGTVTTVAGAAAAAAETPAVVR